ncbi:MAG: hypothetical protein WCK34_11345 [Bacteroidota bacterium]
MNASQNDIDLIERYLLGKLTDAEIHAFEARLEEDREFARKCRLIKTFPEMMSEAGRVEYGKLAEVEAAPEVVKKKFRIPLPGNLAWGALAIVLIVAVALYFIMNARPVEDKAVKTESPLLTDTSAVPVKQAPEKKPEISGVDNPVNPVQRAIELDNPADGMTLSRKEDHLFNWQQETDSFTNFYIYSELQDKMVFWRGIKPGIREYKVPAKFLYPGRFYWYVGTKEVKRSFVISE